MSIASNDGILNDGPSFHQASLPQVSQLSLHHHPGDQDSSKWTFREQATSNPQWEEMWSGKQD